MRIKVENNNDLVRDMRSMAILNVNKNALVKDALYKEKARREKEVDHAINKLENDVNEIKSSLGKILEILESRGP